MLAMIKNGLFLLLLCAASSVTAKAPASWFFSHPDTVNMVLSPSGDFIVSLHIQEDQQQLRLTTVGDGSQRNLLNTADYSDKETSIQAAAWIDNRYLAVQLSEARTGIEDLLDTKVARKLLVLDTQDDSTPVLRVRTKGWLVHALRTEEGAFLYAKSGAYSKIFRTEVNKLSPDGKKLGKLDKIDGGQFKKSNQVSSVQGFAVRWFLTEKGEVKAVLNFNRERKLELTVFDESGEKKVIKSWDFNNDKSEENAKNFVPIALSADENTFYCLDFSEENERAVYKVNFVTDESTLVYETSAYKIVDLILSEENTLQGVKVVNAGSVKYEYIDEADSQIASTKREASADLSAVFHYSVDGSKALLYTESQDTSGEFYFVDKQKSLRKNVANVRPQLKGKLDSTLVEGTLPVDGLDIPYLLTVPKKIKRASYPLIVMPHGGPIGIFDTHDYDSRTQYFAANGYAVLRINFRGSGGYSDALEEAGKKQWGDKMLTDIHMVTRHIVKRPEVDEKRVCAVGYSYGGYAATMLAIKHPELYKCVGNIAGVSDVNLYLSSSRLNEAQKKWAKTYVGDPLSEYDALKQISPVYLADKMTRPIFIAHGQQDATVDVEHAFRLSRMLDKSNVVHDLYIDDDSGHHFSDPEKTIALHEKILDFVEKNL